MFGKAAIVDEGIVQPTACLVLHWFAWIPNVPKFADTWARPASFETTGVGGVGPEPTH